MPRAPNAAVSYPSGSPVPTSRPVAPSDSSAAHNSTRSLGTSNQAASSGPRRAHSGKQTKDPTTDPGRMAPAEGKDGSLNAGLGGCKLEDLPGENKHRMDQATKNMSGWESLALHAQSRNESIPQTRYRETLNLIRAGDNAPPTQGAQQTSYQGSTFTSRSHNPPPNPHPPQQYHPPQNLQRPSSRAAPPSNQLESQSSRRRGIDYDLPGQWTEEVGVPWEERMKVIGKIKEEGKGKEKEGERRKSGAGEREKGKVQAGRKRAR